MSLSRFSGGNSNRGWGYFGGGFGSTTLTSDVFNTINCTNSWIESTVEASVQNHLHRPITLIRHI